MNLTVAVEVSSAAVAIVVALTTGVIWAIQKLLKAGAWFAAISANTTATTNLSKEIEQLRTMIVNNAEDIRSNTRRIDRLERDKDT